MRQVLQLKLKWHAHKEKPFWRLSLAQPGLTRSLEGKVSGPARVTMYIAHRAYSILVNEAFLGLPRLGLTLLREIFFFKASFI